MLPDTNMKLLKGNRLSQGLKPKFGDFAVIAIIILFAAAVSLYYYNSFDNTGVKYAVVYHNGKVVKKVPLNSLNGRIEFKINGEYTNIVAFENGRASISYSTCKDQVCVHTGWLSVPGQSAVCLPNRVILRIEGENADYDGISR
jgi:hypothetical protein